mmetsp:Transcript_426/g.607  ORF Transcript_426/g.607 Transcript_426/m.607 type:complete len:102 (+) Transcript_426:139-444(+)
MSDKVWLEAGVHRQFIITVTGHPSWPRFAVLPHAVNYSNKGEKQLRESSSIGFSIKVASVKVTSPQHFFWFRSPVHPSFLPVSFHLSLHSFLPPGLPPCLP